MRGLLCATCRCQCNPEHTSFVRWRLHCDQCPMQPARQDETNNPPGIVKTARLNYQGVPSQYLHYHQQRDFLALWHGYKPFFPHPHARRRGWERYVAPIEEPLANSSGFVGPCLIWLGALTDAGYAPKDARHDAFKTGAGRKPKRGMFLNHLCHRRACMQPGHIYEGDAAANARDRLESPFMRRYTPPGVTWGELSSRNSRIWETARHGLPAPTPLLLTKTEGCRYLLHDHDWHAGSPLGAGGGETTPVCSICNMTPLELSELPVLNALMATGQGFEGLREGWPHGWVSLSPQFRDGTFHGGALHPFLWW